MFPQYYTRTDVRAQDIAPKVVFLLVVPLSLMCEYSGTTKIS